MRERVEDLGVISEKLSLFCDEIEERVRHIESKHAFEAFLKYYSDQENMEDLHLYLRSLSDRLFEIYYIARHGFDESENV